MSKRNYKVGIIGMGPIGQILAVHFKEAGCEVALTDLVKEKTNLISEKGIELDGVINKSAQFRHVYFSTAELLEHDLDILICSAKTYHVDSILEQIAAGMKKELFLLSAQNGIDIHKKYAPLFMESKIFRMIVNFAGNLHTHNKVKVQFFNPPNYIASVDDSQSEMAGWIADTLTGINLLTEKVDSFVATEKIWVKTILNAALSPLCALSRLTMKEAMDNPCTLEIVEQIIYEAVKVAEAEEIKLPDNYVESGIRYLKNAGNHMPSLAVDFINKQNTEINYMNGKIVEYGKKHCIKTPINLTFTNLINAVVHKTEQRD